MGTAEDQATGSGDRRCEKCGSEFNSAEIKRGICPICGKNDVGEGKTASSPGQPLEQTNSLPSDVISAPRGRILNILSWIYAFFILSMLIVVRWIGFPFWGATILIMLPKALFLLPLSILAISSGVQRCYNHWILQGAIALSIAGPLMGFSVPVRSPLSRPPSGETLRVMSYNMRAGGFPLDRWLAWIDREKIDIVLVQEPVLHAPTREILEARGWVVNRKATMMTRLKVLHEFVSLKDLSTGSSRYSARLDRSRLQMHNGRQIVIGSTHLPTMRHGFLELVETKDVESLTKHSRWWGDGLSRVVSMMAETADEPIVLGGDFNMPADDTRMAALKSSFQFAFEESGWGYGYTRPASFPWIRIDHILTSPDWYIQRCYVGPDFGSDHLPLIAEIVLPDPVPGARVAARSAAK